MLNGISDGADITSFLGSRVVAKNEWAVIRTMPNSQSAEVPWRPACEALEVLDIQGKWLLVDRGWIDSGDVISSNDALEHFSRELSRAPSLFAYCGRCRAYCTNGATKEAIADAEDAVKLAPASATSLYCRGLAHYYGKNLDQALNDFGRAIALDRSYSEAYIARSRAWFKKGLHGRAFADLDDAVRLTPRWSAPYVDRAIAYSESGSREKAIHDFSHALRLQPKLAEAYFGRGMLMSDDGDGTAALQDLTEAIRLSPRFAGAFLVRARIFIKRGDHQKAIADLAEAIRLEANLVEAFALRAIVWSQLGKDEEACAELTKAIRIDPQREQFYLLRAKLWRRLLDTDRAVADYTNAIRVNGGDAEVYCLRAAQYVRLGEYGKAVEDYDKSIELNPRRARPYHDRAWVLAAAPDDKVRDPRQAINSATKACDLTEWKDSLMLFALAGAYASGGDFEAAVRWQVQAIQLLPPGDPRRVEEQRHLELYRRGEPIRGFRSEKLQSDSDVT